MQLQPVCHSTFSAHDMHFATLTVMAATSADGVMDPGWNSTFLLFLSSVVCCMALCNMIAFVVTNLF